MRLSQTDKPRLKETYWDGLCLKRYTSDGARQGKRIPLYYAKPPVKRRKRLRGPDYDELVHWQRLQAREVKRELREYDAGREAVTCAEVGSLSPVRQRQLAEGFASAGMPHLIG